MEEQRRSKREPSNGVSAFVHLPDEPVREAVILNTSDDGVSIAGDVTGLSIGDVVQVVVVIAGEKVRFIGEIRHVEPSAHTFGLIFRSPRRTVNQPSGKYCKRCRRGFPTECNFCSHCGQRLVRG